MLFRFYSSIHKFIKCQTVIRNAPKSSPNIDIYSLWTSFGCNIQYDQFQNTKQVLNAIQKDNTAHISHELKSQGFIISSILTHASQKTHSLWSSVQQNMPTSQYYISITPLLPGKISTNTSGVTTLYFFFLPKLSHLRQIVQYMLIFLYLYHLAS